MAFPIPGREPDYAWNRPDNPMGMPSHLWYTLPERDREDFIRAFREYGKDPNFRDYVFRKIERRYQEHLRKYGAPPPSTRPSDPPMTATEIRERERIVMEMLRGAGMPPFPFFGEKEFPVGTVSMPITSTTVDRETGKVTGTSVENSPAGISIAFDNSVDKDVLTVTLKIPYSVAVDCGMTDDERKLFNSLMRSNKISDQLLGLEALVRGQEVRATDAAQKKREKEDGEA